MTRLRLLPFAAGPFAMPCNASPSTNSLRVRRKSAFALSATKHLWNSHLYELREMNLMCWLIYACPGLFPSAAKARMGKLDRKSTRLNSSHSQISYAVFCLKKTSARKRVTVHKSAIQREFARVGSGDRSRGDHLQRLLLRHAAAVRGVEQLAHPHRGDRAAEQVALGLAHGAVGTDQFQLLVGLDALDHDRHAEIGGKPRHAAQQRQRTIAVDAFQERAVDLHLLQREVMQVAQARIAGAEIVQRDAHAE